jgi:hypothetical protein
MDRLITVRLITPSDHDFIYERPDKTTYKLIVRKGKDDQIEELINYPGPLFAKHPDLNLPTPPPLDKYGQPNP